MVVLVSAWFFAIGDQSTRAPLDDGSRHAQLLHIFPQCKSDDEPTGSFSILAGNAQMFQADIKQNTGDARKVLKLQAVGESRAGRREAGDCSQFKRGKHEV